MTREEAIADIRDNIKPVAGGKSLNMAIKALEQEPCEDCISREEAEAIFKNARKSLYELSRKEQVKDFQTRETMLLNAEQFIHLLPSVTPQPKVGEWLEKEINDKVIEEWQSARCSVCDKYHTTPYMYYFSYYEYCPHCGSKMEVSDAK